MSIGGSSRSRTRRATALTTRTPAASIPTTPHRAALHVSAPRLRGARTRPGRNARPLGRPAPPPAHLIVPGCAPFGRHSGCALRSGRPSRLRARTTRPRSWATSSCGTTAVTEGRSEATGWTAGGSLGRPVPLRNPWHPPFPTRSPSKALTRDRVGVKGRPEGPSEDTSEASPAATLDADLPDTSASNHQPRPGPRPGLTRRPDPVAERG